MNIKSIILIVFAAAIGFIFLSGLGCEKCENINYADGDDREACMQNSYYSCELVECQLDTFYGCKPKNQYSDCPLLVYNTDDCTSKDSCELGGSIQVCGAKDSEQDGSACYALDTCPAPWTCVEAD